MKKQTQAAKKANKNRASSQVRTPPDGEVLTLIPTGKIKGKPHSKNSLQSQIASADISLRDAETTLHQVIAEVTALKESMLLVIEEAGKAARNDPRFFSRIGPGFDCLWGHVIDSMGFGADDVSEARLKIKRASVQKS